MPIAQTTTTVVSCDNPTCPNVGNYGSLTPPLTTDSETGWISVSIGRMGDKASMNPGRSITGVFCSKFCIRAGVQAAGF